jgi:hypothetical protein
MFQHREAKSSRQQWKYLQFQNVNSWIFYRSCCFVAFYTFRFEFYKFSTFLTWEITQIPLWHFLLLKFRKRVIEIHLFCLIAISHNILQKEKNLLESISDKRWITAKSIVVSGWNYDLLAAKTERLPINWMNYCNETLKNEKQLTQLFQESVDADWSISKWIVKIKIWFMLFLNW